MGRRLVRAREALRRMVGKPGRRSGIDRREGTEVSFKGKFFSAKVIRQEGKAPHIRTLEGQNKRSGKDRRGAKK